MSRDYPSLRWPFSDLPIAASMMRIRDPGTDFTGERWAPPALENKQPKTALRRTKRIFALFVAFAAD